MTSKTDRSAISLCVKIKHGDSNFRVPTAQGKQGKRPKKIRQGKHREFRNFVKTQGKLREFSLNTGKTQGILLAQVVNVLILKVKDIAIVATKKIHFEWVP